MESIYKKLVHINFNLAHFLRYLRKQNNWTQEHLAEVSTIDYKHIQRLESVKYINDFRFSTLLKLLNAFDIDILDFLGCIVPNKKECVSGEIDCEQWNVVKSLTDYKS
jgi:transcriptional regulator with XRE-family HTH domain